MSSSSEYTSVDVQSEGQPSAPPDPPAASDRNTLEETVEQSWGILPENEDRLAYNVWKETLAITPARPLSCLSERAIGAYQSYLLISFFAVVCTLIMSFVLIADGSENPEDMCIPYCPSAVYTEVSTSSATYTTCCMKEQDPLLARCELAPMKRNREYEGLRGGFVVSVFILLYILWLYCGVSAFVVLAPFANNPWRKGVLRLRVILLGLLHVSIYLLAGVLYSTFFACHEQ